MSRDLNRAAAFAEKHGAQSPKPAHNDLEVFLSDAAVDAVVIATPDKLHARQTIASAEAGKHVLVEKPMAAEIYGEKGYALCDNTLGRYGGGTIHIDNQPVPFETVNPCTGEIEDFAAAITEDRLPEVDGAEGLRNVELLVAAAAG